MWNNLHSNDNGNVYDYYAARDSRYWYNGYVYDDDYRENNGADYDDDGDQATWDIDEDDHPSDALASKPPLAANEIRDYYDGNNKEAPLSDAIIDDVNPYLFVSTMFLCVCLSILMCCMVSWTRRKTRQKHRTKQAHLKSVEATLHDINPIMMFVRHDDESDQV